MLYKINGPVLFLKQELYLIAPSGRPPPSSQKISVFSNSSLFMVYNASLKVYVRIWAAKFILIAVSRLIFSF